MLNKLGAGNKIQIKDFIIHVAALHNQARRFTQADAWPGTGENQYDYAGRKATMTTWQDFQNDEGRAITQWIYDEQTGHLIYKRYDDGQGPDYAYTKAGRLEQCIWARGEKTDYKYTNAGDLEKIDYKHKETPDVEYKYDRIGRRVETKQGKDYVQKMTYDDLGRILTETVTQPGVETYTLTRGYNDAGKPSGYQWKKGKDQLQVEYGYHTSGRLDTGENT